MSIGLSTHGLLRLVLLTVYLAVNVYYIATEMKWTPRVADLALWRELLPAFADGTLYRISPDVPYVWSPVIAPIQGVLGSAYWPQAALHFAIVALLRDWRIVLLLGSYMFWPAVMGGNPLFTLIVVGAWLAWDGNDRWALVFLALSVAIPRPLQVPLMLVLLWTRPQLRRPFAAIFAFHALLVLATGYGLEWVQASLSHAGTPALDISPRAFVGDVWLLIALPAAVLLTLAKRPGWAGLMASPYWLAGYLLLPLIEVRRTGERAPRATCSPSGSRPSPRYATRWGPGWLRRSRFPPRSGRGIPAPTPKP